jgi:hypothetical protein
LLQDAIEAHVHHEDGQPTPAGRRKRAESGAVLNTARPPRDLVAIVGALLLIGATAYLTWSFGPAPLVIVGAPAALAWLLWYRTYLQAPIEPDRIMAPFLLTVAGFGFHAIEEYLGHYGPAVGRLFGIPWTNEAFVVIVLALLGALFVVAVGVHRRIAMAGLVAIVFMTTRLAEVALFVFPLLRPAIQPDNPDTISALISGALVLDMPNHYVAATGTYYFPGMYTVLLPIVPAVVSLWVVWRSRGRSGPALP